MNHKAFPLSLALVVTPISATHASTEVCAPTTAIAPLLLLRQASLDLRGRIPSYEEYEAVREASDPAALVEQKVAAMIGSPEYATQVRRYHRSLVWSAVPTTVMPAVVGNQRLLNGQVRGQARAMYVGARTSRYRGRRGLPCLNQLQTEFDDDGVPIPITTFTDPECSGPQSLCRQEGYVMVEPYWAPGTEVAVCAYDAQVALTAPNGQDCASYGSGRYCGCGENLQWCAPPSRANQDEPFRRALEEEPLRIFESVIMEDRPYTEAFTTETTYINGALSHYYRFLTGMSNEDINGNQLFDAAVDDVPVLDFEDESWVSMTRDEIHAGALTTPGYLFRFASNRGRANRFFEAFYCAPFIPPEDGLPPEEPEANPNLRERPGCDGCHAVLEPAAAHWARWRSGGQFGYFQPSYQSFTIPREDCLCGSETDLECSGVCSEYFVTQDNSHPEEFERFGGLPLASTWLDPQDFLAVEAGPSALVDDEAEQLQLARCMVRNFATHLLGRALEPSDLEWTESQAQSVYSDGLRFNGMVRRMIADPRYRSVE